MDFPKTVHRCTWIVALLSLAAEDVGAEQPDRLTVDQIVDGITGYYQRIRTITVEFSETFDKTRWVNLGKKKIRVRVQVEGKWTVKVDDENALNRAPERLSLTFVKGADAFVTRSVPQSERFDADSVARTLLFTWNGEQAQRLERRIIPNQVPGYDDSFGHVSGSSFGGRSDFKIETFLFYFIDVLPRKSLRERFKGSLSTLQIVGEEQVAGVRAIKLEEQQPKRTWHLWVAPEHDFLVVRQEVRERGHSRPWYVLEVNRVARFGELWLPTQGSIQDNMATVNQDLDPDLYNQLHHFTIRKAVANEPLGDALFKIEWPRATMVKDYTTDLSYRTGSGDVPTRTAALDEALAQARASRPPPVPSGPRWSTLFAYAMLGALVLAAASCAAIRWRRSKVLG